MAEREKTPAEIKAENDLMMAKAAIKLSFTSFHKQKQIPPPDELKEYWDNLDQKAWQDHLALFTKEVKNYKQHKTAEILLDLDNYIKDCKKLNPTFKRSKEELLLMIAIGQINIEEFIQIFSFLPSNREKLDRKIEKQIKMLDWQDDQDLMMLDELTEKLGNPKIKKNEVEKIDKEIDQIENNIKGRKVKRDELAIKLVEWRARGNIDIADSKSGKFRLDA